MLPVLLVMTLGIVLGYVFRNQSKIIRFSEKATSMVIYLLLFLLGIGVGLNKTIVSNMGSIGLQALLITLGAMFGSLLLAYFTYKLFFVAKNEK
ncbi:LysO family transporter [uncultured Tenacibaculum sp.]|uniref:LysO family transporter n=1 Tax=uncultured Tenacibaculum sp. TaxID=174713 RepID=UPI0026397BDE|nr:LysO family transporter [uncultured Tenacibaculum sp.]